MKSSQEQKDRQLGQENLASESASISFPPDIYHTLKEIVVQKKMASPGGLVCDAAEQFVEEKRPLMRKSTT